ncbi:hypothetical protein WA171_003165 [Blastocystis sp. BT1]
MTQVNNTYVDNLIVLLFCIYDVECTSMEQQCMGSYKYTQQFNVNWKGVPTYRDILANLYEHSNCTTRSYTALYHDILSCTKTEKNKYHCESTTINVWVRIWEEGNYKNIIDNCGSKFTKKYQDIIKNPCVINGDDQWKYIREQIGFKSTFDVVMNGKKPETSGNYAYGGKCVWNYEIEGIWSTLVITILLAFLVCLILLIALIIYTQKRRSAKRNSLMNRTLLEGESGNSQTPSVSYVCFNICFSKFKVVIHFRFLRLSSLDMDSLSKHDKSVVVGEFEFSSIPMSSLEGKEFSHIPKSHILLKSIEIQTEKGPIPLLLRGDETISDKMVETKDDDETMLKSFYEELFEQSTHGTKSQTTPDTGVTVPKTLAELSQYHLSDSQRKSAGFPGNMNTDDLTLLQLLNTISKLPSSFRQPLLNLLKVVEEKYEEAVDNETKWRSMD